MTELKKISFSYGNKMIFRDFSHIFAAGKITAVTGPSGAGKTTLLRLLAGLEKPISGEATADSPAAVLFQEPRLCPWLTAMRNVSLVLRGKDADERATVWLERVGLRTESNGYPHELSGGMQQRVALARTLAYAEDCPLVLLDEPFKGLDKALREEIEKTTYDALRGKTVVMVTHDETDAAKADCRLEILPYKE